MINVLIEGWIDYPHSYSIVNIYQILALLKKDGIKLFLKIVPPYNEDWELINLLDIVTVDELDKINKIPRIKNVIDAQIDIIYRISYPFDTRLDSVPIILFYTSEFQNAKDFPVSMDHLKDICNSRKLMAVTPSNWSAMALLKEKYDPLVISHGVDITKFYPENDENTCIEFRKSIGIPDSAFVFLNVSAMTGNKNIKNIIKAFYKISFINTNVYLILKGLQGLYPCEELITSYIKELFSESILSRVHWKYIRKRIIFIPDTFSYHEMRVLYNSSNCYLSPYIAEGFNMPVLEAVACGIPVIVSKGGPTDDFTNEFVAKYPLTVPFKTTDSSDKVLLLVDIMSLQDTMMDMINDVEFVSNVKQYGPKFVKEKYTWDIVTEQLYTFILLLFKEY
jgi:glycosyltransferase involved in cell wall biosynthesis